MTTGTVVIKKRPKQGRQYQLAVRAASAFRRKERRPYSTKLFEKLRLLGSGSFGKVWLVRNRQNRKELVIKEIIKRKQGIDAQIIQEVSTLRHLQKVCGTYLLCYDGFFEDANRFYIVTKYLGKHMVPLSDLIGSIKGARLRLIAQNLMKGMRAMHQAGVAHRDIKPANILVSVRGSAIRYIDFGGSCVNEQCHTHDSIFTPSYARPDVIYHAKNQQFTLRQLQSADAFSLVLTIIEMYSGPVRRAQYHRRAVEQYLKHHPNMAPDLDKTVFYPIPSKH